MAQQTFPVVGGGSGSAINWRGAWSSGTTYAKNDAVSESGSSYVSVVGGNIGNNPALDSGANWAILALEGSTGSTGATGQGFTFRGAWASTTAYHAFDVVTYGGQTYEASTNFTSGSSFGMGSGESWNLWAQAGNVAGRMSTTITTGSLAQNATENLTVTLAKSFALGKVITSGPTRIRLYSTAADRTADATRAATTAVPYGTQHGVITDLVLDTSDKWTWIMSPLAYGANEETTPSTSISYAITNLSTSTTTITITFWFTSEET